MIVAIDGPAASGKSTTAKFLAEKLGFVHLNSGLLYRAITYIFINNNCINDTTFDNDFLNNLNLTVEGKKFNNIFYNNDNITNNLRSEEISKNIKFISNDSKVRKKINHIQRNLVKNKNVVCEGRDIGSVVFPNAEFKFYLNAEVGSRVLRRFKEQVINSNNRTCKDEIKKDLINRDNNDLKRKISPLIKTNDSIEIDTTHLTIEEQVDKIYDIIKKGI